MLETTTYWKEAIAKCGAYFAHDNYHERPHIRLPNLRHTGHMFRSDVIVAQPEYAARAADGLAERLLRQLTPEHAKDLESTPLAIMGPSTDAIIISHLLAAQGKISSNCSSNFTEEQEAGSIVVRMNVRGKLVLLYKDTIMDNDSVFDTKVAIEEAGGRVLPFVLTFCNRAKGGYIEEVEPIPSNDKDAQDFVKSTPHKLKIISLVTLKRSDHLRKNCPYCRINSPRVQKPNDPANWRKLTKDYF